MNGHRRLIPPLAAVATALSLVHGPQAASAQIPTQTRLTQSAATSAAGQPVTLTAVVEAPSGSEPTGEVVFRDGSVQIGVASLEAVGVAVSDVSAGRWHSSCALASDGRVFCWGQGSSGQLGNGTNVSRSLVPVQVTGITSAVALSVGFNHACAVLASGAVQCWGSGLTGALGNGTTTSSSVPVTVSGISTAVAIASGASNSCAVLASGTVRCWGSGSSGQLGNGATTDSSTPVAVTGLSAAVSVAAGFSHNCATLASGGVQCWGRGEAGELGHGATENSPVPVTVSGLAGAAAVAAGGRHSCAVLDSGAVRCWGSGASGQLGHGATTNSSTPVAVTGLSNAVGIAAGGSHSCAVLGTGDLRCWGGGVLGQLGHGISGNSSVPVAVSNVSTAVAVSGSSEHSCAALSSGAAQCWGWGQFGALGNGQTVGSAVPVTVAAMGDGEGSAARAVLTTRTLLPGERVLTAEFPGNETLAGSTSAPVTHSVAAVNVGFVGGGAVFAPTDACGPGLGTRPHPVTVRYSPSELGGLPSGVSIVWRSGSEHLALWGPMQATTDFFGAAGRGTWSRFVFYPTRPLIRVVSRQVTLPADAPLAEAQELALRLRVQNFAATPGCSVTLAAVIRRQ